MHDVLWSPLGRISECFMSRVSSSASLLPIADISHHPESPRRVRMAHRSDSDVDRQGCRVV